MLDVLEGFSRQCSGLWPGGRVDRCTTLPVTRRKACCPLKGCFREQPSPLARTRMGARFQLNGFTLLRAVPSGTPLKRLNPAHLAALPLPRDWVCSTRFLFQAIGALLRPLQD